MFFAAHVLTSFSVVWLGGSATPAGQLSERGCQLKSGDSVNCLPDFVETMPQVDTDAQEHMAEDGEHALKFCHNINAH